MNSDADEYMQFAVENHQGGVSVSELEQKETVLDFISMCEAVYLRHAENVISERSGVGCTLTIKDQDGSELMMRVGEYTFSASNLGVETCQRYVSFAVVNYYGRIDDTYRYALSEDGQRVIRQLRSTSNMQLEYIDASVGKSELQKVQELLFLGEPRNSLK